jgi:hypothetical protein
MAAMQKPEFITALVAGYGAVLSTVTWIRQVLADHVKVKVRSPKTW